MKTLQPWRDPTAVRQLAHTLGTVTRGSWRIMEVCGGQTHAFVRFGIDRLLPEGVELLHGPGCPVCVTPAGVLDQAIALAVEHDVLLCTFGDMLRVPGSHTDLLQARARGAHLQVVYSPLDAVALARKHPDQQVVFFGVGFETTAPTVALAIEAARASGLDNFSVLASHVLVPPALRAVSSRVDAFLAAGHVCTIEGMAPYHALSRELGLPIVVTGFEPVDLLRGLLECVRLLEEGRVDAFNAYPRAVRPEGNPTARAAVARAFDTTDQPWRGMGTLPDSGLRLRDPAFDAAHRFGLAPREGRDDPDCLAGEVLQGLRKPTACPAFGTGCTPDHPLGATMVSSEGACAAYWRHRRHSGAPA